MTFSKAAVIAISSKTNWSLDVTGANFSNGSYTIPAGRIKLKLSSDSTYKTLTTSPVTLLTNQAKNWPKETTVEVDYQITLLPSDQIGTNFQNSITGVITADRLGKVMASSSNF